MSLKKRAQTMQDFAHALYSAGKEKGTGNAGGFLIPGTQVGMGVPLWGVPVRRSKERVGAEREKSGMGPLSVFLHYDPSL